jgi:hypothetical protein
MSKPLYRPDCGAKNNEEANQCTKCGLPLKLKSRRRVYNRLPSNNSTKDGMIRDQNSELFIPLELPPMNVKFVPKKSPNDWKTRLVRLRNEYFIWLLYLFVGLIFYEVLIKYIFPIGIIWGTLVSTIILIVVALILVRLEVYN